MKRNELLKRLSHDIINFEEFLILDTIIVDVLQKLSTLEILQIFNLNLTFKIADRDNKEFDEFSDDGRAGCYYPSQKLIEFGNFLDEYPEDYCQNVIYHELCHALFPEMPEEEVLEESKQRFPYCLIEHSTVHKHRKSQQ